MSVNYGSKRIVVGAHYGTRDFLAQRASAVAMALFTIVLLARVLMISGPIGYEQWAGVFAPQWMKFLTLTVIVALRWHAWIGVRDIWMDYVQPVGLRFVLHVVTIIWLVGCVGWGIQVLWRL